VKDKGPGGHILTGPIYIEGAEAGDVLEVKILAINLPFLTRTTASDRAALSAGRYPYAKMKIIPLDEKRMVAKFAPGIEIPLHPFSAAWATRRRRARAASTARRRGLWRGIWITRTSSLAPTLYIPIHAPGALFEVGDGHAGQGDGEVDITALETSLIGTFQFVVRKDMHLRWPPRRNAHALHHHGSQR